jgi:hypothetical protein
MKHLLTTLLLSCALSVLAVTPTGLGLSNLATVAAATPPASGSSFLINQGFEGTGYDNGETWTGAGTGTVDADETTTVIAGSQSLHITLVSQTGSTYAVFTGQGSVFVKFRLRVASTNGGTQTIATLRNGTTVLASLILAGASRVIRANAAGGSNNTSTGTGSEVPVNQDLYVWFEYIKGTGSNAVCRVGWAATDSKPTFVAAGTTTAISANGSSTSDANRIYLGNPNEGYFDAYFDTVQVSASAF